MGKRAALKNLGLVSDDGKSVYLIQKTGKVANPLKPEPSHILITKATEGPGSTQMVESAGRALNTGELATEWTSTLLSCGGAIVGTGLIITGGIALPLTGGASIGVVALAYGGTGASWLQCGRGGYRLFKYRNDGDASFIDRMNADESDVALGALLDVVSLASAGGALRTAINTYRTLKAVSSRSALDWLKGMSRAERRRLSAELAKQSGLSKAEKLLAIQSGALPKKIASSNNQKVVAQEMLSATAAAMAMAMGGSAVAGVVRSPRINNGQIHAQHHQRVLRAMVQSVIDFLRGLWLHHVLRPRLFATYRQGQMLEADIKNIPDIWDVCDKWVPDADYLYLMGALAEPVDKNKHKFRGVIAFSIFGALLPIGSVMIFGFLEDLFLSKPIDYLAPQARLFNLYLPALYAALMPAVFVAVAYGRAKALPFIGITGIFYIVWLPAMLVSEQLFGVSSSFSWITSLCGLYIWITLNSEAFTQLFATKQQLRILRIIMKTAMNEQAMRRSKTLQRLIERKNRQGQKKKI